jgi:hypothetical protein
MEAVVDIVSPVAAAMDSRVAAIHFPAVVAMASPVADVAILAAAEVSRVVATHSQAAVALAAEDTMAAATRAASTAAAEVGTTMIAADGVTAASTADTMLHMRMVTTIPTITVPAIAIRQATTINGAIGKHTPAVMPISADDHKIRDFLIPADSNSYR